VVDATRRRFMRLASTAEVPQSLDHLTHAPHQLQFQGGPLRDDDSCGQNLKRINSMRVPALTVRGCGDWVRLGNAATSETVSSHYWEGSTMDLTEVWSGCPVKRGVAVCGTVRIWE